VLKLADFGLAKQIPVHYAVARTPIVVTLAYRAPEVLFTKGRYDYKIDVWSVGCLAVELLTNRFCFTPRNEVDLVS
jgi:cyclin-dependent kinase 2